MVLWMKAQMEHLELPENLANAIAAVFESSYYCGIAFFYGINIFII